LVARKIFFPFKLKVLLMLVTILGVSISFYVWFAIDIFKKDKAAYIYENGLLHTENLSSQASLYLKDVGNRLNLLLAAYARMEKSNTLERLIEKNDDFIDLQIFKNGKNMFSTCNPRARETEEICHQSLIPYLNEISAGKSQVFLKNIGTMGEIPHFIFSIKALDEIFILRVNTSQFGKILDQNNLYISYVLNQSGSFFYGQNHETAIEKRQWASLIASKVEKGTFEGKNQNNELMLISYSKIPGFNQYIISEISQASAFSAARYLIDKSLYFALLVLSVSLITGVFFSRNVTGNINQLYLATKRLSQRDFTSKVVISSYDEVGVLADSFNLMSEEIVMYMSEMKEKSRLENEMKVASLVQTAFFPKSEIESKHVSIAAYYTPATECGGDWWGHIEHQDKTILILADATGHGVPAALLTATINSAASILEKLSKQDASILSRPENILSLMNHAVCSVGANIMLTCFVGIIDVKARTLSYSNASHNPPLLLKNTGGVQAVDKDDFIPLTKALGPRLGHDLMAAFNSDLVYLDNNDLLILYTDGLIECANQEGKQWGKRRFLQSLIKNHGETTVKMRDNVIMDLNDYKKHVPNGDDITLIVTKMNI